MEKSKIVQENRMGRFSITDDLLFSESETLMKIFFSKVLIVRCEYIYSGIFKYTAFSNLFEPTDKQCEPPNYNIVFTKKDDGEIEVTTIKQTD